MACYFSISLWLEPDSNQMLCEDNAAHLLNRQGHSEMYSYSEWRKSKDKSNSNFYENFNTKFFLEYAAEQMERNRLLIRCLIRYELQSFISSSGRTSYKVLSLGCGPGSDLLAVLDVFQTRRTAGNQPIRIVDVTGVDKTLWPMKEFRAQLSELATRGPISARFFGCLDMEDYVDHALAKELRFDLIIMSFAEVKTKMTFVSEQLPRLLRDRDRGRIFIVDNDIPPVWNLSYYGFKLVDRRTNTVFMAK